MSKLASPGPGGPTGEIRGKAMMINSYEEWSPLKEVIVGSGLSHRSHEIELSFKLFFHDVAHSAFCYPIYGGKTAENDSLPGGGARHEPQQADGAGLHEDIAGFVRGLEDLSVQGQRPRPL